MITLLRQKYLAGRVYLLIGTGCILATAPGAHASTLSAFDRISVAVVGAEEFSSAKGGTDEGFVIGADGQVFVPQLGKIPAAGREESELEQEITGRLQEYLRVPSVSVRLVSVSPVSVDVSGAVYRPGTVTLLPETLNQTTIRDVGTLRTAFNAIKQAGGIRPDADLAQIQLERDGKQIMLAPGKDMPVITGDRIIVASLGAGAAQTDSANVPSQLAPSEITIYVSGQDLPTGSSAGLRVKPGTTLFGALTAAGATGQSFLRSGRQVALIRRDPVEGKREVQTYDLDRIVNGETDPKLLQDDSIAINAGPAANSAGVFSLLSPLLSPLVWLLR